MIHTDPLSAAPVIAAEIAQAQRILLLTHVNPDGDAIGSMLGMWHALTAMGKDAVPLASSPLPDYTLGLPGATEVQVFQSAVPLPEHDMVLMVDTATLQRVGQVFEHHGAALIERPLVIVDHHVTNVGEGLVNLIVPESASCAELVYRLLRAMGAAISPEAATCLLLGLTTDTQSYQTSSTNAASLRAGAELLELGADQRSVIRNVYFDTPFTTLRLVGLALGQVQREGGLLWTRITQAMQRETGAEDEAGDDVMRHMQRVAGSRAFVLFKERRDGTVKISLRSVPGINVAALAATWGGGGHTQAAGASLPMGLEAAEREVLDRLRTLVNQ